MTKEEIKAAQRKALIDAGLTEEMADKALGVYVDAVEYTRFQQVIGERNDARSQVSERDKSITALQGQLKGNEDAGKALKDAQEALETKDNELAQARKHGAIQLEITKAKARNDKAVLALLDDAKITMQEDGSLKGLSEQLEALQKSDAYLFGDGSTPASAAPTSPTPAQAGFNPPAAASSAEPKSLADAVAGYYNVNI